MHAVLLLLACGPRPDPTDDTGATAPADTDTADTETADTADTDTADTDTADTDTADTDTADTDTAVDTGPAAPVERSVYTDAAATIECERGWEWGSSGGTFRVAPAGDVDGDGVEDIVAGCYGCGDGAEGRAWLLAGPFAGTTSVTDATATFDLTRPDGLGLAVAGAGDLDGDGFSDLLLTEARYSSGDHAGRVQVVAGPVAGTMDPRDVAVASFVGEDTGHGYPRHAAGYEVGVGNFDGDGVPDVFVSAPWWNGVGAAYAVFGPFDEEVALASEAKFTFEGDGAAPSGAVANLGDVNGDGVDDLAIGPGADRVLVYLGPLAGTRAPAEADAVWITPGETGIAGERGALAAAGDVNADGYADALVASPLLEDGGSAVGGAYLVTGPFAPSVALADAEAVLRGAGTDGVTVDGPGDLDGDGRDDLVVGAAPAYRAGAAYVLLGPVRGARSVADARYIVRGIGTDELGADLDHADFDGDGLPELLLTGPGHVSFLGAAWVVGGF